MEKIKWIYGQIRWFIIRCLHVITKKYFLDDTKYGKNRLYSDEDGNKEIRRLILSNRPFAFCRFSFEEYGLMIRCKTEEYFGIRTYAMCRGPVNVNMFSECNAKDRYSGVKRFCSIMLKAISDADAIGVWRNLTMGDVYIDTIKNIDKKYLVSAMAVEPYLFSEPWSKALKGKKVLVVSPFHKEIQQQYLKREHLWDNKDVLPEFELKTVASVFYIDGCKDERFSDWFEALEYLYKEVMKNEFDVALLGCGAFGFPLAAMIKRAGKQAIHIGGALQLLFGIKGKRWDNMSLSKIYNDFWIRPGEDTKPVGADRMDNACYW